MIQFKKNEIPWKKLIEFHQDIAKRAEVSFFSLRISNYPTDRWTSFENYEMGSYAGPWETELVNIKDSTFRSNIQAKSVEEVFLGGPCYLKWQHEGKNFIPNWRPVFYKKVILQVQDNNLTILPDQANWEISPLVLDYLNQKSCAPETPIDEAIPQLLERAAAIAKSNNTTLAESLRLSLISWCNDTEELFEKTLSNDNRYQTPSEWILFTPPSAGPITRYQLSDYRRILERIEKDPQNAGGLKIFEGYPEQTVQDPEILPIVQLNESQKKAVSFSLSSRPATVISGPPGCGKSQVVVSLLLNAWASGKSVLFASNNNQAVDVVFERLQKFETSFPIAIRAGAKKHNRILAQLRDTINFLTGNRTRTLEEAEKIHHQINCFEEQRQQLKSFIDSKIPQKVDEAQRAAAQAYKKYKELVSTVCQKSTQLQQEYENLKIPGSIADFETEIKRPYRAWLDKYIEVINQIQANEQKKVNLESEANLAADSRNQLLSAFGMDVTNISNWSWLSSDEAVNHIKTWHSKAMDCLKNPIEQSLEEIIWKSDYSKWKTPNEAKQWAENASKLAEEIHTFASLYESKTKTINQVNTAFSQAHEKIQFRDIHNIEELDKSPFEKWAHNFNHLCSLSRKKLDWLPFSDRSKIVKILKQQESVLRSLLPIGVWSNIGPMNESGRKKLAVIIEDVLVALNAYIKWKRVEEDRKQLECQTDEMIKNAHGLFFRIRVNLNPSDSAEDTFENFKDRLLEYSEVAFDAAEAIAKLHEKETIQNHLKSLVTEFSVISSGNPLKEMWLKKQGCCLFDLLSSIQQQSRPEDVMRLREVLYTDPLQELCEIWRKASRLQNDYQSHITEQQQIKSPGQLIYDWWSIRPSFISSCFELDHITQTFSQKEFKKKKDNIFTEHYKGLIAWHDKWLSFKNNKEPKILLEMQEEKKWAIDNLKTAVESLPNEEKANINSLLDRISTSIDEQWPTDQLSGIFQKYSLSYLNAQLDSVNKRLEEISFEKAKADWIRRQLADIQTQTSLDQLYDLYSRNNLQISEDAYTLYSQALKAVPVWITTAQSSHSIPLQENLFDILVIDEATQCTVTNIIPLIYRASKLVIIGDQEQLPAIPNISASTENVLAEKYKVECCISLLGHVDNNIYKAVREVLPNRRFDVILLDEHYRSHPLIIGFSNLHIYQKNLKLKKDPTHLNGSVYKHDIDGSCQRGRYGTSWCNLREIDAVVEIVRSLKDSDEGRISYGVVTPFKAHFESVQERLQQQNLDERVKCGTAHQFQGDERDIMIFSAVVSNGITDSASRWVQEPKNLVNVAITRARQSLHVVADFRYCYRCNGILKDLANYVDKIVLLRDTSQAELSLFSWMMMEGWNPSVHEVVGDIEVDFVLRSNTSRIAIEVDGRQHHLSKTEDQGRDAFLKANNYKVLRLPAREIMETPSVSISKIKELYV